MCHISSVCNKSSPFLLVIWSQFFFVHEETLLTTKPASSWPIRGQNTGQVTLSGQIERLDLGHVTTHCCWPRLRPLKIHWFGDLWLGDEMAWKYIYSEGSQPWSTAMGGHMTQIQPSYLSRRSHLMLILACDWLKESGLVVGRVSPYDWQWDSSSKILAENLSSAKNSLSANHRKTTSKGHTSTRTIYIYIYI